jgi:hypothetical protein
MIADAAMLIDAIAGIGFPVPMNVASGIERIGLAKNVGNQWNEEWRWDRAALEKESLTHLEELYAALVAAKERSHAS